MVAVMTQDLDLRPAMRVLELGTGTGYQTAVLAHLVGNQGRVYTIERMASLAKHARNRLDAMGIANVRYYVGDGSAGWPAEMWNHDGQPAFDRILVTAGTPTVPAPLVDQLKPGGMMVLPVGDSDSQTLRRILKRADGTTEQSESLPCRFVPLVGAHAWQTAPTSASK
jgi:protein-L-isoaspartate(D-aspartate) O-methyltransferase